MFRVSLLASLVMVVIGGITVQLLAEPKPNSPQSIDQIAHLELPTLDLDTIRIEDDARQSQGLAPRYAIANPVTITPTTGGTWEDFDANSRLWRLRVSSRNAVSINLGFTRYFMPSGGQLVVRAADNHYRIRPFTEDDNMDHGQLWTPPVGGSDIVIEVTVPAERANQLVLELGSINIGYRRFGDILDGTEGERSGACNVDVRCSTGDPWRDQIPGVAVISTGGSTFCTGFMVNNVRNDRKNYFMTANHCGISSGNAASLVAFWNYENSVCRGVPGGGGVGDGQLNQFNTGSTFRASASVSDFTLVELSQPPNPAYGVTYLGWDRTGANPPSGACIHHPSTDEKRITLYDIAVRPDRPSHGSSWGCSPFPGPGDNSHISVYWSLGVTEPGSSGSPLFDNSKRVIGQLHGGPSACGQTGDGLSDCYGRFSRSWTGNGTNSTRLSNWLDPDNTGANNVDTLGRGINATPTTGTTHYGAIGGPFSNSPYVYNLQNTTPNSANYTVSILAGGSAPLLIDGVSGPVNGSVPASSSVNVSLTTAPAANSLGAGIYTSTVRIQDTTNNITYDRVHIIDVGRTTYASADVPKPINDSATATSTLNIGPADCISDVDVALNITHPNIGDLIVELRSPLNTVVRLHNRTGGSADNVVKVYSQGTVNPDGPGSLNDYINQSVNGTWTLTVQDQAAGNTGTLNSWSLLVNSAGPICQPTASNVSATVPDSVSTPITLVGNAVGGPFLNFVITSLPPNGYLKDPGAGDITSVPYTLVGGGNIVSYRPRSYYTGPDSFAFKTNNTVDSSAATASISVTNLPQVYYDFPLNSDPGWTREGDWAFGQPTGQGQNGVDPTSGYTGSNVFGYNLSGNYTNNINPTRWLRTNALNFTGIYNITLSFRRWLCVEPFSFDKTYIQVSNNGTTWTTIWQHTDLLNENAWSLQTFNISAIADNQPTVYVRWGMGNTDNIQNYPGWNIDDIQFIAVRPPRLGDLDNDNDCDDVDLALFVDVMLGLDASELHNSRADINSNGKANGGDVGGFTGARLAP